MPREPWDEVGADLYRVLGVPPDATGDDIQQAWRSVAKRTHPDRGGDQAAFRAATVAYEVLSDPHERARYDRTRRVAPPPGAGGHGVYVVGPPREDPWMPPSSAPVSRLAVLVFIVAGVIAVTASYVWPVFTIITGILVGTVVTIGYVRLARGHRGLR